MSTTDETSGIKRVKFDAVAAQKLYDASSAARVNVIRARNAKRAEARHDADAIATDLARMLESKLSDGLDGASTSKHHDDGVDMLCISMHLAAIDLKQRGFIVRMMMEVHKTHYLTHIDVALLKLPPREQLSHVVPISIGSFRSDQRNREAMAYLLEPDE